MNEPLQPDQRARSIQVIAERFRLIVADLEANKPAALPALLVLDTELRQFFDILSSQEPVTPAELTILEDVGALLDRAKTLAATQRTHVLDELKSLRTSRSGIQAYESADATH